MWTCILRAPDKATGRAPWPCVAHRHRFGDTGVKYTRCSQARTRPAAHSAHCLRAPGDTRLSPWCAVSHSVTTDRGGALISADGRRAMLRSRMTTGHLRWCSRACTSALGGCTPGGIADTKSHRCTCSTTTHLHAAVQAVHADTDPRVRGRWLHGCLPVKYLLLGCPVRGFKAERCCLGCPVGSSALGAGLCSSETCCSTVQPQRGMLHGRTSGRWTRWSGLRLRS